MLAVSATESENRGGTNHLAVRRTPPSMEDAYVLHIIVLMMLSSTRFMSSEALAGCLQKGGSGYSARASHDTARLRCAAHGLHRLAGSEFCFDRGGSAVGRRPGEPPGRAPR